MTVTAQVDREGEKHRPLTKPGCAGMRVTLRNALFSVVPVWRTAWCSCAAASGIANCQRKGETGQGSLVSPEKNPELDSTAGTHNNHMLRAGTHKVLGRGRPSLVPCSAPPARVLTRQRAGADVER